MVVFCGVPVSVQIIGLTVYELTSLAITLHDSRCD